MVPDQWYDENGVWTGSATMLPLLLDGRGRGPSITAAATTSLEKEEQKRRWQQRREGDAQLIPGIMYTGSTNDSWQVQSLAFPSDPWEEDGLLVQWEKVADNPVLFPPDFINVTDFRDPTTAWWDDKRSLWMMVIGSHLRPTHTGIALLYQSADFLNWELVPHKFLHLTQGTGMWECVDFYPIPTSGEPRGLDTSVSEWAGGVKHVLKASMDDTKLDFYTIGHYDTESLTFTPDEEELDLGSGFRYDWGRYYASKTFYDPLLQRRILFGWVNESDTRDDDIIKGWSGVQSIPRQVWFDNLTQNSLIQWPIEEIKSLYNRTISLTSFTLESGGIFKVEEAQGAQWDITVSFTKPTLHVEQGPFMDDDSGGAVAPFFMGCNQNEILSRGALGPFGVSVLSSEDLQEQTRIYFYRLFMQENSTSNPSWKTLVCNDLSRSTMASHVDNGTYGGLVTVLQDEDELMLRILVDHSIVETFAQGGRTVITTRSYPTIALDRLANIYLFNDASTSIEVRSLTVHELSDINIHYIN
ncbi:hypothetical protein KP509_18G082000 [Ceratopteris richardii]|nr:hypothetical protein KP509_18G082000 [Ceratopteris richardii]